MGRREIYKEEEEEVKDSSSSTSPPLAILFDEVVICKCPLLGKE
jgi:hypothetical protein